MFHYETFQIILNPSSIKNEKQRAGENKERTFIF